MFKRQWQHSWMFVLIAFLSARADAHPVPFTYLDVHIRSTRIDLTLVAHAFDLAHDLEIDNPTLLMDASYLSEHRADIFGVFAGRLRIGSAASTSVRWLELQPLPERQSVRLVGEVEAVAGAVPIRAALFPYDAAHQSFVNVFEHGTLTLQAILDASKPDLTYFPGSTQGALAVMRRFAPDGARHIITGAEHWLFLIGLLLLSGTRRQVVSILVAFLAADVATTALIVLKIAHPAARLTEPALALSVVYIGADNLMVRGGKDMRPWIALAFGVLHGFWFGGALALMDLPRSALGWSLVSFALGAALAQSTLVVLLALTVGACRQANADAARTVAVAGSMLIVAGGTYLFVQRVFFPGGVF